MKFAKVANCDRGFTFRTGLCILSSMCDNRKGISGHIITLFGLGIVVYIFVESFITLNNDDEVSRSIKDVFNDVDVSLQVPGVRCNSNISLCDDTYSSTYMPVTMRYDMVNTSHVYASGTTANLTRRCNSRLYDIASYPKTSIIITFHGNEKLHHIVHTLHSIWQNTPLSLVKEVILIDDASPKEEHQDMLRSYINRIFGSRVKVLRNKVTLGLIKNRLAGIRLATGEVVVSMDAHMEVREHWLEALLYEIKKDRRTMVTSYLDWMRPKDDGGWMYEHGPSDVRTIWFWMNFAFTFWKLTPEEKAARIDPTEGIESPCSVGTIWAIDKSFFQEIGEFDEGMAMWGGENIDIVIRTYLFGGKHINVPCSHAAHLEEQHMRDYRAKWSSLIKRNFKRVAEVWFGDYLDTFYMYNPALRNVDCGDLKERKAIQKRAPHNFEYFLKRGYPQMATHTKGTFAWGLLKNKANGKCLFAKPIEGKLGIRTCTKDAHTEVMIYTRDGHLRLPLNVLTTEYSANMKLMLKNAFYPKTKWTVWLHRKGGQLQKLGTDICIAQKGQETLTTTKCNSTDPSQRWTFEHYTDDFDNVLESNLVNYNSTYMKQLREFQRG